MFTTCKNCAREFGFKADETGRSAWPPKQKKQRWKKDISPLSAEALPEIDLDLSAQKYFFILPVAGEYSKAERVE